MPEGIKGNVALLRKVVQRQYDYEDFRTKLPVFELSALPANLITGVFADTHPRWKLSFLWRLSRAGFWAAVKAHKLAVWEGFEPAILGVALEPGVGIPRCVIYDYREALTLHSDSYMDSAAPSKNRGKRDRIMFFEKQIARFDLGASSPYFVRSFTPV